MHRTFPLLALLATFAAACSGDNILTGPARNAGVVRDRAPVTNPYIEPAFYEGQLVHFLLPSAASANPNDQVVADCFRVGPRVPAAVPIRANVYVLLIPGADQESACSTTGEPTTLVHNHVFGAAPGDPNYDGHFLLILLGPGPNYPGPQAAASYNSEAAVQAGIAAGELAVIDPDAAHVHWVVMLR